MPITAAKPIVSPLRQISPPVSEKAKKALALIPVSKGISGQSNELTDGISGQTENKRTRGRPKKWESDAERKRSEREKGQ